MYTIEKKGYGYKLTFEGSIDVDEMNAWIDESKQVLLTAPSEFGVFVDMRTLNPLGHVAQGGMEEGLRFYKAKGMLRSVVIVDNVSTQLQYVDTANDTGSDNWERYVDASSEPDWEAVGIAWIVDGIDPDK